MELKAITLSFGSFSSIILGIHYMELKGYPA